MFRIRTIAVAHIPQPQFIQIIFVHSVQQPVNRIQSFVVYVIRFPCIIINHVRLTLDDRIGNQPFFVKHAPKLLSMLRMAPDNRLELFPRKFAIRKTLASIALQFLTINLIPRIQNHRNWDSLDPTIIEASPNLIPRIGAQLRHRHPPILDDIPEPMIRSPIEIRHRTNVPRPGENLEQQFLLLPRQCPLKMGGGIGMSPFL